MFVNHGEEVDILDTTNDFTLIKTGRQTGYIKSIHVKEQCPAQSEASLPFERSKHAGKPLSDEPLTVGTKVAFYMQLPEDKGGIEWYLGSVARMSRSNWVDVEFPDGKLWCSMKPSERGTQWVALA